jgi:hypothetical protein
LDIGTVFKYSKHPGRNFAGPGPYSSRWPKSYDYVLYVNDNLLTKTLQGGLTEPEIHLYKYGEGGGATKKLKMLIL